MWQNVDKWVKASIGWRRGVCGCGVTANNPGGQMKKKRADSCKDNILSLTRANISLINKWLRVSKRFRSAREGEHELWAVKGRQRRRAKTSAGSRNSPTVSLEVHIYIITRDQPQDGLCLYKCGARVLKTVCDATVCTVQYVCNQMFYWAWNEPQTLDSTDKALVNLWFTKTTETFVSTFSTN